MFIEKRLWIVSDIVPGTISFMTVNNYNILLVFLLCFSLLLCLVSNVVHALKVVSS